MADTMVSPNVIPEFVDKRKVIGSSTNPAGATFKAALQDIGTLRAALTTASAARYPASYLNTISVNDMISALRYELEIGSF